MPLPTSAVSTAPNEDWRTQYSCEQLRCEQLQSALGILSPAKFDKQWVKKTTNHSSHSQWTA